MSVIIDYDYCEGSVVSIEKDFEIRNKIACFDLDGTIIKTKSGKTFAINYKDWVFFNKSVIKIINKLYNDGYCILVFSNQKNLKNREEWATKVTTIFDEINVPFKCFASVLSDQYRKPIPSLYRVVTKDLKVAKESFFCGDAAGRVDDFSDTDYKFAVNCKLQFKTPENVFGDSLTNANKRIPVIKYINLIKNKNEDTNIIKKDANKEIIIMVGPPGSGKSTLIANSKHDHNVISQDVLKTRAKCLKECGKLLKLNKNIIIDNTNPDVNSRKDFIKLAEQHGYTIKCIVMVCSQDLAIHNSLYRSFKNNWEKYIPIIVYRSWFKKYTEPKITEGFSGGIIKVNSFENVPNDCDYFLYFS